MGQYAPNEACTVGIEWFPDRDNALLLDSDVRAWGLILEASTSDTISTVWPVLCALFSPGSCMSLEVFNVTGTGTEPEFPVLSPLTSAAFYPASDLFVSTAYGWGAFSGYVFTTSNLYQAIANPNPVPGVWPNGSRPIQDDSFITGIFGAPMEYAFQVGSLAGTHSGRWVTRLRHWWTVMRVSEAADVNAVAVVPYLMIDGQRYFGVSQTIDQDGLFEFVTDWSVNPSNGLPWTPTDVDRFDSTSGSTCGFGWYVYGTGSANVLATIALSRVEVESAPTDERLAIGSWCPPQDQRQGWQPIDLLDTETGAATTVTLTPGDRYLFVLRKQVGHTTALCRLDEPGRELPGPPFWTSTDVDVDVNSKRVRGFGEIDSTVAGFALEKASGGFSLDSQLYATTSPEGLDTQDAWPMIDAYFRLSPVDAQHRLYQQITPVTSGEYGWLRLNVCTATGVVDGDLTVVVRDASNTNIHTPQVITVDDLEPSTARWQTLGVAFDDPPVLTAGVQYTVAIESTASHSSGWLVQVVNAGMTSGPPQGPPSGAVAAGFGHDNSPVDRLLVWADGELTVWDTAAAEVNLSIRPDPPTDLVAIENPDDCCIGSVTLVWVNPVLGDCGGGFGWVEVERSDDNGATWNPICRITDPAGEVFDDYEWRSGVIRYRARVFRADGVPSEYTSEVTAEMHQSCCGLSFVSNEQPELNVHYPDVGSSRVVEWPRPEQVFEPHNRDFYVVVSPLENRGVTFNAELFVRGGFDVDSTPCVSDLCSDWSLQGVDVFSPLLAITRADLSYVCVRNEHGNRWFMHVVASSGEWHPEAEVFTASITAREVTNTPSTPDVGVGS